MKLPKNIKPVNPNFNVKQFDKPNIVGFDFETDHKTGKPMLLSLYYTKSKKAITYFGNYETLRKGFLHAVNWCRWHNGQLAFYREIDMTCLLRLFTDDDKDKLEETVKRVNKVPFLEYCQQDIKQRKYTYTIGIKDSIRSSLTIYYKKGEYKPKTIKAYNIQKVYQSSLAEACKSVGIEYEKGDNELHIIDWKRFLEDKDYKNRVIDSNQRDAKAHAELASKMYDNFKNAFGIYPNTLYSPASITKSYLKNALSKTELQQFRHSYFLEKIKEEKGEETALDFYHLCAIAYNGGLIDAPRIGYTEKAFNLDIASAYVYPVKDLLPDLSDAEIEGVFNSPMEQPKENELCIGYGTVTIDEGFHSLPLEQGNSHIYPQGTFRTAYTWQQREQAINDCNASFENEQWYRIKYKRLSPVSKLTEKLLSMRDEALQKGDKVTSDLAKTITLSIYGITYECIPEFEEKDGKVEKNGKYKEGQFTNFLYATIITSTVRVQMAKVANEIERQGGRVLLFMTDGIYYDLPNGEIDIEKYITYEKIKLKAVGWFEPPKECYNFMCLGTGIYEYTNSEGKFIQKTRGLNPVKENDSIDYGDVPQDLNILDSWRELLKTVNFKAKEKPKVLIRQLVTPGLCNTQKEKYPLEILGKVIDFEGYYKEVDYEQIKSKRELKQEIDESILYNIIETLPIYVFDRDRTKQDKKQWFIDTEAKEKINQRKEHSRERKKEYIEKAVKITGKRKPTGKELTGKRMPIQNVPWKLLEEYFGIDRKLLEI